jgi:hypothetical protein
MERNCFLRGSCQCGAYTFRVSPSFIKFGFESCHCSICRKVHASPVVLWTGINAEHNEQFGVSSTATEFKNIDQVKESLSKFRASPECLRYFCGNCGTHLFIEYDRFSEEKDRHKESSWEGEIHFPTALLDENSVKILEEVIFFSCFHLVLS